MTPDEVASLFEAVSGDSLVATRSRAILSLMYRTELKVGALVKLAVRHYDSESGVLTVPAGKRVPAHDKRLDPVSRKLLDDWLAVRAGLRLRGTAPLFCILYENRGRSLRTQSVRQTLTTLRGRAGIQKRVTPEGLRASRAQHRKNEAGRFEAVIAEYVTAPGFRRRYRAAYRKWADAHQLLETAPIRDATTIGHLCREAIIEFSDQLAAEYEVGPFDPKQTKQKMRAVFAKRENVSTTLRRSLEALLEYWQCLSDLANRQEHGRRLTADDSRAVVFQTMLVMREVDSALAR